MTSFFNSALDWFGTEGKEWLKTGGPLGFAFLVFGIITFFKKRHETYKEANVFKAFMEILDNVIFFVLFALFSGSIYAAWRIITATATTRDPSLLVASLLVVVLPIASVVIYWAWNKFFYFKFMWQLGHGEERPTQFKKFSDDFQAFGKLLFIFGGFVGAINYFKILDAFVQLVYGPLMPYLPATFSFGS